MADPPLPKGARYVDDDNPPLPPGATYAGDPPLPPGATYGDGPPPDDRNGLQRAFDNLTTVTPEQEQGHSWLTNKAQEFGAGAIAGAGAPLVHPIQTAEGLGHAIAHPIDTAEGMAKGVWAQPASILGNLVGGADLGLAAAEGGSLLGKIPTKAKAGRLFDEVADAANGQPVKLTRSTPILERAMQLSERGHGTITPLDRLYSRINTINPLAYEEARDRASALSRLTGEDQMRASPALKAHAKELSHAFNQDIGDTAEAVGKRPQYEKAMKQYARASRNREIAGKLGKVAVKTAAPAALGYGGYKLARALTE